MSGSGACWDIMVGIKVLTVPTVHRGRVVSGPGLGGFVFPTVRFFTRVISCRH